jgi:hypothetical protein
MARDPNKVLLLALLVLMAALLTGTAVAAAPTNDAFDAATELSGREASASGTNKDATKEAGEPAHAGKTGGASVWYRWTAPASGKATVSTCDSDFDTLLGVYTGGAVNALTEVAANDDACGLRSSVSFQAVQGATYRIAIDGLNAVIGTFELLVSLAPANDDFANAEAISGESGSVAGTTVGASRQPGEPDYLEASVWYRWTAPSNGWATFELCGSGFYAPLHAFTGATLETLQLADTWYSYCADDASRITITATEGVTYSIPVSAYEGTGDFTLKWNRNPPPPEPPYNNVEPTITGTPREGSTLTGSDGEWYGTPPFSFTYAWWRCNASDDCNRIDGATARSYTATHGDVGSRLYIQVTATNEAGSDYAFSYGTAVVRSRGPSVTSPPAVNGVPRVGIYLDASPGVWTGLPPIQYAYQWQQCDAAGNACRDLANETASVLEVQRAHVGSRLRVVVTASNVDGSVSAVSEPTAVVPQPKVTQTARCVVPNVRGMSLLSAKARIRRGRCVTGSIRRKYSGSVRRGRVIAQTPRAGARLRRGAKVNLVLSKGRKR